MIELIAQILIFGFLISLVLGLIGVLVYHVVRVIADGENYDRGGGYKTYRNQEMYRRGKIPHKFTGEYRR